MGIAWTDSAPAGPRIEGRIFWALNGAKTYFIPLGEPIACWVHYTPLGSRPHEDHDCPHCPKQYEKKAWVPALVWALTKGTSEWGWHKGAFELTANCLHDWSSDLICCLCCAARQGSHKNGKVSIELAEDQSKVPKELPEPFPVLPLLYRAWGIVNRNGQLLKKPSEILPLRKAGGGLA